MNFSVLLAYHLRRGVATGVIQAPLGSLPTPFRCYAYLFRSTPNLVDTRFFVLKIILGVKNSCSGAHHLQIASCGNIKIRKEKAVLLTFNQYFMPTAQE